MVFERKAVSALILTLLLTSMLTAAFNVQPVKSDYAWAETIYIRADGSIQPSTAPISSVDNVTYTLTDNIAGNVPDHSSAIVIQRDNIVIDGAGYTLQGPGQGSICYGIVLMGRSHVTIKNMKITEFYDGVHLNSSSYNSMSGNNITNNVGGIVLSSSSSNSMSGNNITDNGFGIIYLESSSSNSVSGNNITNIGYGIFLESSSSNRVSGNNITSNGEGIGLFSSSNYNSISGNNITANSWGGIWLDSSWNNSISGNNITANGGSVGLVSSSNYNSIFHNNFIGNAEEPYSSDSVNVWDDGYPSGGNYWTSDYTDVDQYSGPNQDQPGSDGIWDHPYVIDENNRDNYPLVNPWTVTPPSADDIYWLAKAIMSEASVGTPKEQIAVGWTVLNRFDSGGFGSGIEGIVKRGYAYNQEPTESIMALAEDLLEREIPDPIDGATYFFSPRGMPKEGDDTTGFDVGGGLQQVPLDGQDIEVYFPSFAKPQEGIVITETTARYLTAKPILTKLEWRNLAEIRNWYYMFYRPYTTRIQAEMKSPSDLRVYDSQGLATGLMNGTVVVEIPGSHYFENTVTILFPNDTYRYVVAGMMEGLYGLTVTAVTRQENITFSAIDIPTTANATHQYAIDWTALSRGEEGVTVQADSDGDGIFEHIFASGSMLTRDEFLLQTAIAGAGGGRMSYMD